MVLHIRIGCILYKSYVDFCETESNFCLNCRGDKHLSGIDFEILKSSLLLGLGPDLLNTITFSLTKFKDYGVKDKNGTWSGLIGALGNGSVDIAVPTISVDHLWYKMIDYSLPVGIFDSDSFLVHPRYSHRLGVKIFDVLSPWAWTAGCLTLLLLSIIIAGLSQTRNMKRPKFSGWKLCRTLTIGHNINKYDDGKLTIFGTMFAILFEKKVWRRWRRAESIALVTLWSLSALFALRLFAAVYVKKLTPNLADDPFRSLQELAKLLKRNEYKLILWKSGLSNEYIDNDNGYDFWKVLSESLAYNTPYYIDTFDQGLNKVNLTEGTAFEFTTIQGAKVAKQSHLVNIVPEEEGLTLYSYGLRKGWPYSQQLASGYLTVLETGIAEALYRKYGLSLQDEVKEAAAIACIDALTLQQTVDALLVMLVGTVISFATFAIEILLHVLLR